MRTHLAEIPLGGLRREAEHPPATDLVATSFGALEGARQELMSAVGDHALALLATRPHDVAKVCQQPIDVVAQVA